MKKALLLLAVIVVFASCQLVGSVHEIGNGVPSETKLDLPEFDSVSSCCALNISIIVEKGPQSISLICDENLVNLFDIRVEDKTLVVDTEWGTSVSTKVKSYLKIITPKVDGVSVSGSGDVWIHGSMATDGDFALKTTGSGDIMINGVIQSRTFSSSVSGSGGISVFGVLTRSASFKDSGSGNIIVDSLTAEDVTVDMTGSGDVTLICKGVGYIDSDLSGSGDLILSGTAYSLKNNTSGSGRVDTGGLILVK